MPFLFIRTCNSDFGATDEGADYNTNEEALATGVQGAVAIATDEIHRGERTAAVEVCIEDQNGSAVLRTVVAISVSSLMVKRASLDPDLASSPDAAND